MNRTTRPPGGSDPCNDAGHACPASGRGAIPDNPWPRCSVLELGALPTAVPCARLHARQVLWEWRLGALREVAELVVSDSLNNQHELDGLDVAAGQGNRASTQGQVGLVHKSSGEEEAGEPFRTGCPLSVALRSRSLPNAIRRSRHSSQSRNSLARSLSLLTCGNVRSSVNRELVTNAIQATAGRQLPTPVRLRLSSDGSPALVEVWDADSRPPQPRPMDVDGVPDLVAESGRGLLLVAASSKRWGWYPERQCGGKVVWSELQAAPVASGDLTARFMP